MATTQNIVQLTPHKSRKTVKTTAPRGRRATKSLKRQAYIAAGLGCVTLLIIGLSLSRRVFSGDMRCQEIFDFPKNEAGIEEVTELVRGNGSGEPRVGARSHRSEALRDRVPAPARRRRGPLGGDSGACVFRRRRARATGRELRRHPCGHYRTQGA